MILSISEQSPKLRKFGNRVPLINSSPSNNKLVSLRHAPVSSDMIGDIPTQAIPRTSLDGNYPQSMNIIFVIGKQAIVEARFPQSPSSLSEGVIENELVKSSTTEDQRVMSW